MSELKYKPLTKEQVIDAIERKKFTIPPMFLHKFWGAGLLDKYGNSLTELASQYPDDVFAAWHTQPGFDKSTTDNPNYRFGYKEDYSQAAKHSIGEYMVLMDSWDDFDQFLNDFPDPNEKGIFDHIIKDLPNAGSRYKLGCFWSIFHEKFWEIRGMENLMVDYYEHMDELKIMGRKFLEFHKGIISLYAQLGFDGIFSSDDLGHQSGPLMSPAVFEELYLPLYKELIGFTHSKNMHFWLHSCGDNTLLMDYLIEAGLDVLHPIQKHCMDEQQIFEKYSDSISFLYGIDVQQLLPNGSTEDVRNEVRRIKSLFQHKNGGLLLGAGNGIMPDTPLENIDAFLDEICTGR